MRVRDGEGVQPFLAMEILERAQELEHQGADVVHLEIGEPDFPIPRCAAEAAARAVRDGQTHYTHSLGLRELREEIAASYRARDGVEVDPGRVIVTSGSSGGLTLLMAHLVGPGDAVAMTDPGYACYPNFVRAFHGVPLRVPVDAADAFRMHAGSVRERLTPRTRALLLNSPANPTGAVQPRETMEALAGLGVPLISDEIYRGLEYGEPAAGMLSVTDDCFVLDGFSKRYAMTGWRIGWLVAPPGHVPALQRLQQNLFICAGSVAQHAALAALRDGAGDARRMREEYAARRELMLAGLCDAGLPLDHPPAGAYYAFPRAGPAGAGSLILARRLLEEALVGVTPGIDFGPRGEGHLRLSFASSGERIQEGLLRMGRWLRERTGG